MDTKEAYTEKMIEALQNLTKELGGLCSQMDTLVQEAGKLVQEYQKNRQTVVENLAGARNEAAKAFTGTEAEKQYCAALAEEVSGIEKTYLDDLAYAKEHAEEAYEYSRGSDYDLLVEDANRRRTDSLGAVFDRAMERGISRENLESIFGDDYEYLASQIIQDGEYDLEEEKQPDRENMEKTGSFSGKYSKLLLDYAATDMRADEIIRAGSSLWRTQWTGIMAVENRPENHIRMDIRRLNRSMVEVSACLVIALKTVDRLPQLRLPVDEYINAEDTRKSFAEDIRLTMGNRIPSGQEEKVCFYSDSKTQGAQPLALFYSLLGDRRDSIVPYQELPKELFLLDEENILHTVDSWVDPVRNDIYMLGQSKENPGVYRAMVNGKTIREYDKKPARSEVMEEYHDRLIYDTMDQDRKKEMGKEEMASQGLKEADENQVMKSKQETARRR